MFNIGVCHEDMTGKRGGENVAGMNMNATGMSMHPFQWNCYVLVGKYLHYSILMMSLHYVTNDVIDPFLKLQINAS